MGVTILDKTKPPAPKFIYEDWAKDKPLANATRKEKDIYWGREEEKWATGKGCQGLNRRHYFFLTQILIKDSLGKEFRPWWRDVDEFIWENHQQAIETQQDMLIVKRREVGLTTLFGAVEPLYNSLVNPGSISLLTSADKDRVKNLFSEKTRVGYDNLDDYIRPAVLSSRQEGFFHFAIKKKDGSLEGLKSQIICKETVDNPEAFETYRATSIFLDEFFLHPKAPTVLDSSQACLKDGFLKIAPVVMGGSCGITSRAGAIKGQQLWTDAHNLRITTVFIPGWMGISKAPKLDEKGNPTGKILNFCPNGYSDKDLATEWILKTREIYARAEDKSRYNTFVKEYPLSIEEVFEVQNEGLLPKEAAEKITVQSRAVRSNPPPIGRFTLKRDRLSNRIIADADKKGKYIILEHPRNTGDYISGTDPIPFISRDMNDGSEYCIAIKNRLTDSYVAYYADRSYNADAVIPNAILLQDYYGGAKTMLELNRGGVAKEKYKDLGRTELLAKRPTMLGLKFKEKKSPHGFYKNDKSDEKLNAFLIKYILNYSDNIYFPRLLDELKKYLIVNHDLVDAVQACELYDADITRRKKKKTKAQRTREIAVLERGPDGTTRTKYIQIPVN